MQLTKLSAAPLHEWRCRLMPAPSHSCAGTASQLIPGVRRTVGSDVMDPAEVKARSERIIQSLGGKTLDWLPWLDRSEPRGSVEVAERALAMHALLGIYFQAPVAIIAKWIRDNGLDRVLSRRERALLDAPELTEQNRIDLYWYIEALWALAWVGGLIADLSIDEPVGDSLASLLPDIERGEGGDTFKAGFALRPFTDIFQMLDVYFRAHWYARDGQLNGYSTGVFKLDIIMERRKALEWVSDRTIGDWDETPEST
jgi:hypothetical protein